MQKLNQEVDTLYASLVNGYSSVTEKFVILLPGVYNCALFLVRSIEFKVNSIKGLNVSPGNSLSASSHKRFKDAELTIPNLTLFVQVSGKPNSNDLTLTRRPGSLAHQKDGHTILFLALTFRLSGRRQETHKWKLR